MILEFLEFVEMERSLTKFEFCSKNKDGNGCYFEMCVCMRVGQILLAAAGSLKK